MGSLSERQPGTVEGAQAPVPEEEPSAMEAAVQAMRGRLPISDNALTVLTRRYLRRDRQGTPQETPEQMFRRVARNIAEVDAEKAWMGAKDPEATEDTFYRLMTEFRFQPNSPTLMNAGRDLQQLSACFVLPVGDSMEEIFESLKNTAIIHKSGGGTGFAFSRLRPSGSVVRSTSGVASGPVSFMRVFNAATEAVKQGGTRRGANMGILRVNHPDIRDFIACKKDLTEVTNFNISVAVTEEFMETVLRGGEYNLRDPHTGEVVGTEKATEVFDMMVAGAWDNGDPGIIFIDRINKADPVVPVIGEIEATNPCGEQPLHPGDSCNLGSVNLVRHLRDGEVDWDLLRETIWNSIHFLDNVIDANRYPLPLIEETTRANRKVGLGVMGWADLLVEMGIPYCSDRAIQFADELMSFFQKTAHEASRQLAKDRGAFPNWEGSRPERAGEPPRRNSTATTIAPTGTISIIADCSGGIEPLFAVAFFRNQAGVRMVEVNPRFVQVARERGFHSEELMRKVAEEGSIQGLDEIPEDVKAAFRTSHDIPPEWHVRMQAAFQRHTDNAVSKTVNFSHDATQEDVKKVYMLAHELGCKGVTVYRDGSREGQILSTGKTLATQKPCGNGRNATVEPGPEQPLISIAPRPRPSRTVGSTERMRTGCGNLYVTMNEDDKGPVELFSSLGKAGGCAAAQTQAISRLISLCLRAGVEREAITKHLRGIRCHNPALDEGQWILSCPDAIGIALQHWGEHHVEAEVDDGDGGSQEGGKGNLASGGNGRTSGSGNLSSAGGKGAKAGGNGTAMAGGNGARASAGGIGAALVVAAAKEAGISVHGIGAETGQQPGSYIAGGANLSNWMGACPECGGTVAHQQGCITCHACGFTKCG